MAIDFTLTRISTAPIDVVFDAFTDHRSFADYVWLFRRSTLDRQGTPAPNGVGAIRRMSAVGPPFVEEITEYERPHRYAYRMLSGAPTTNHVGTVDFSEAGTGTRISWHLRADPRFPGTGPLLTVPSKFVINALLDAGVTAAERPIPAPNRAR